MYSIYNSVSDLIIFSGNENEFVKFVRLIAVENEDNDMSITCLSEAKEYVEGYCGNLELLVP